MNKYNGTATLYELNFFTDLKGHDSLNDDIFTRLKTLKNWNLSFLKHKINDNEHIRSLSHFTTLNIMVKNCQYLWTLNSKF